MNQLIKNVEQWSIDKGLNNGNSDRQALKFYEEAGEVAAALSRNDEEAGEVAAALSRNDKEALKDGIGDTVVTLIILAQQHNMSLEECLQCAYEEIKGRTGKMINGTFVKDEDLYNL
ncbi:MazG-like family protein [Staphylococcus epidermidis]|uniref:MazG-like family protein n=1 Tax=Staphylococcus epidermidis TaxID=1282 RepID=UPI000508EC20|nr:MazG-like family protein [Staphylococcus epidermidis]AIR83380.1 phosphoribosyl-ATP pyrophosphohydrolase family protein [Staphylococcus epidermidis]